MFGFVKSSGAIFDAKQKCVMDARTVSRRIFNQGLDDVVASRGKHDRALEIGVIVDSLPAHAGDHCQDVSHEWVASGGEVKLGLVLRWRCGGLGGGCRSRRDRWGMT